jgi:citrate lyase beta subunit
MVAGARIAAIDAPGFSQDPADGRTPSGGRPGVCGKAAIHPGQLPVINRIHPVADASMGQTCWRSPDRVTV